MKNRLIGVYVVAVSSMVLCFGLTTLLSRQAIAQSTGKSAGLRVMASDGVKPAVNALLPEIERSSGEKVATEFNASKTLTQEILGGKAFDVAILTSENIAALIQQGKIVPDSRAEVARAGIGVGIREGSPKPDISSEEAFKQTLLKAKAITFNPSGASATYFKKIVEQMGIAEKVSPKFILDAAPGRPQMIVAEGKADMVITLIPEILDSKGITLAGPFPEKLQTYFNFSAGVSTSSHNPEKSEALIKDMIGPSAAATLKAVGMEQR
jgi:molybdate transport system substrate-binding protein